MSTQANLQVFIVNIIIISAICYIGDIVDFFCGVYKFQPMGGAYVLNF